MRAQEVLRAFLSSTRTPLWLRVLLHVACYAGPSQIVLNDHIQPLVRDYHVT